MYRRGATPRGWDGSVYREPRKSFARGLNKGPPSNTPDENGSGEASRKRTAGRRVKLFRCTESPPPSTHTWFHPRLVGSEIELVNTMHINILTNKNKLTRVIIEAKCHFVDLNHDIRNFPLVKIKIRIWGKA